MNGLKFKFLALAAILAGGSQPAAAQQEEVDQALRELNIMSNIFAASLEQEADPRHFPMGAGRQPDSLYLEGQGMVFSFRTAASWYLPQRLGEFLGAEMEDFYREMQIFVDDITDRAGEGRRFSPPGREPGMPADGPSAGGELGQLREETRRLGEQLRNQREEVRQLQREVREMQLRRREGGDDGGLARMEERLDAALSELDKQREAYESYLQDYEGRRQSELDEFRDRLTLLLATTLCDYGPTLRALEEGQYVTLILEDFGDEKDQVYVFPYGEVASCESAENLLDKAVSYQL